MQDIQTGPTLAPRLKLAGWLDAMADRLGDDPDPAAVAALHDRVAAFADEMIDLMPEVPAAFADAVGGVLGAIEHRHATLTATTHEHEETP